MSQENVEIVRNGIAAWNQRDAELWLRMRRRRSSGCLRVLRR